MTRVKEDPYQRRNIWPLLEAIVALQSYKDLIGWRKSIELTNIYLLTQDFPKQEIYGLTSQIRRSAVSIPSNIAEG